MDDIARHHYDLRFERDFLKRKANAFQDFFSELMQKVYPSDFIATRPWGKIGDRKNDGYLKSERKLFQVYAPDKLIASKAVAKIDKDFKGALSYWEKYFDKWVFVHNGRDLNTEIAAKLLSLGRKYQAITFSQWGYEALRQEFWKLSDENIVAWFGPAPSLDALLSLGYEDIRAVLIVIAQQAPSSNEAISPVDAGKIAANALSANAEALLSIGMRKAKLVEQFFFDWHDPTFGDVVADAFKGEYERLRSSRLTPDEIFGALQDFAGGRSHRSSSHETAVLAVLAFLFEQCDIFEPSRPKST